MTEALTVEELWQRAHELVRRGDFANAVRDLSQCYQTLQALQDPRIYEVHKRWTEVHQLYLEDGARQSEPPPTANVSIEAEAEAAANAGDLDRAIELYQQAAQRDPSKELVRERLEELRAAKSRAAELSSPPDAVASKPAGGLADDDWSEVAIESSPDANQNVAPAEQQAVVALASTATTAPAMAPEDAPVGMQSLDVPFSVGEAIEESQLDELPLVGAQSELPGPASDIALLEELLARVQANRRKVA